MTSLTTSLVKRKNSKSIDKSNKNIKLNKDKLDQPDSSAIPGFLSKTFEIFSNVEFQPVCGWNESGDAIEIKNVNII